MSEREWRFYIDDMIRFASNVLSYTHDLDQTGLVSSSLHYDATLRNLELIGQVATHVPAAIREANPDIPWRMIIATRNRLIQACPGIDDDTVWSIIVDDVPGLLGALERLRGHMTPQIADAERGEPGYGDYTTPVMRLQLCGSGAHPGGCPIEVSSRGFLPWQTDAGLIVAF